MNDSPIVFNNRAVPEGSPADVSFARVYRCKCFAILIEISFIHMFSPPLSFSLFFICFYHWKEKKTGFFSFGPFFTTGSSHTQFLGSDAFCSMQLDANFIKYETNLLRDASKQCCGVLCRITSVAQTDHDWLRHDGAMPGGIELGGGS